MEEDLAGECYQISVDDGRTVIFDIRPNETIKELLDRLEQTAGIHLDVGPIPSQDIDVRSFFKKAGLTDADGEKLATNTDINPDVDSGVKVEEVLKQDNNEEVNECPEVDPVGLFCAVPGCPTDQFESNVTLFLFPTQKKRCMEWVEAIKRDDLLKESVSFLSTQLAVCALHFGPEEFLGTDGLMLKETAVPTILPEPGNCDWNSERVNVEKMDAEMKIDEVDDESHPGSLCRLCAQPLDSTPVFLFRDGDSELADKINACLPITVSRMDVLPKQICKVCRQRLELHSSFTEECVQAQNKLIALTHRFLANGLKTSVNVSGERRAKVRQHHCCPLCCTGGMQCISDNNNQAAPSTATTGYNPDDPIAELYSDCESEPDQLTGDTSAAFDLVYLPEDRVFASYECEVCEEVFPGSAECLQHCGTHAAVDYYPCVVCGLVFPTETLLTEHFAHHNFKVSVGARSKERFKTTLHCATCGIKVNTRKSFILHKCSQPVLDVRHEPITKDLVCTICGRSFTSQQRAEQHVTEHEESYDVYTCPECDGQFKTERMVQNHVDVVHEGVEHRCAECGLRFIGSHYLERHARIHKISQYKWQYHYQCTLCDSTFTCLGELNKHLLHHNGVVELKPENELACNKCGEQFTQRGHLQHHMETAHDTMGRMPSLIQYQCKVCAKRIKSSAEVLVHRTSHWKSPSLQMPHVCEYCGEAHPSPNALARHRRFLHPDEHPYVCTLCEVRTRTLYEARVHRKTHTGYINTPAKPQPRIYQCDFCPSLFSEKSSFIAHTRSHKVVRVFECDMCEKRFPEKNRLLIHKRMHTGEKPYSCGTCGKRFSQTSAMYSHALLHTGELPHACDLCPRRFRIKSDRDSHRRTHTGEKPYKCQHCSKTFRTGQVFYQHRMIHTGERRFACDVCGRAFKRSHTLACHRRIHTGEKPNVCDICGKGFRQRTDMRKHKMSLHNVSA